MKKIQICDTDTFLVMALEAERTGYNRQVDTPKLNMIIDPKGIHVCSFSMIHEHIAGELVDPHIRSLWLVKLKNETKPIEVSLDISMERFEKLHEHEIEEKGAVK